MANKLSIQQLLECLRELHESEPGEAVAIRAKHDRMGADKALAKAAETYNQFWDIYGLIKSFEVFYWLDKVSEGVNEEIDEEKFSLNAFPWANKHDLDFKALIAWHLHNILDNNQDPCLTKDQAMMLLDRMRQNQIDSGE